MIYSIVAYGDAVLKKMCTDVDPTSPEIKQLTEDMFETMYAAKGVGHYQAQYIIYDFCIAS